ncbi:MAG: WGR domain-containing protein [Alphaproteobacteria bacterium]|nr:WGR domain-containing protein [Alphaproteobacteria bacterium]
MRRFEKIEGNKAEYWEIDHDGDVVVTRSGIIGKAAREREKSFVDDMAAEVDFDKQIHAKRRDGWVEVAAPSEPLADFDERAVSLRPLDGSKAEAFDGAAMKYLLWRMVEVQLFDRHRTPPDLSRWGYRAWRQLGLDAEPTPASPGYDEWVGRMRELSVRDRAADMESHLVGAFKFRDGSHWIVTPEECVYIAAEAANRKLKRKKDTDEQAAWLERWCAFHARAAKAGGYEVVPV